LIRGENEGGKWGYNDVIKKAWICNNIGDRGWPGIEKKLAYCRRGLLAWRAKKVDATTCQITLLHNRLLDVQGVDEENSGDEVITLRRELQALMEKSDLYWRQRAKTIG
jgi:hypothetical protein